MALTLINSQGTLLDQMFRDWETGTEDQHQSDIAQARDYFAGNHPVRLTTRLRQFLGPGDNVLRMNLCRSIVSAVVERLAVSGFSHSSSDQSALAWSWWRSNGFPYKSTDVHEMALRDGEAFVAVSFAEEPRLVPHPRYVSPSNGGDGFGCRMRYANQDPNQEALYAEKRWFEWSDDPEQRLVERMTLYFPDRIEKYADRGEGFGRHMDATDGVWPLPWVDSDGSPLGIPIVHFRNHGMTTEMWDAIPVQNLLNKSLVDLVISGDQTAFRFFVSLGWIPTKDGRPPAEDGSNWMEIEPGHIIGTTKSPQEASFQSVPPADITPMVGLVESVIMWMAVVSDTPLSRFQITKLIAAEGTLKQQETPLLVKVKNRQDLFGESWERVMNLSRKLFNLHGEGGLDDSQGFRISWESATIRDDEREARVAESHSRLGVPDDMILERLGYSSEQIEKIKQSPSWQARQNRQASQTSNPPPAS